MMMMDVRPIRDENDLSWALAQIEPYFTTPPAAGTPEADRFDVLAALIEGYETHVHAVPDADPAAVLRFAIADLGRSEADLADILGGHERAADVLNGRGSLSAEMIRRISTAWKLPAEALLPLLPARDAA